MISNANQPVLFRHAAAIRASIKARNSVDFVANAADAVEDLERRVLAMEHKHNGGAPGALGPPPLSKEVAAIRTAIADAYESFVDHAFEFPEGVEETCDKLDEFRTELRRISMTIRQKISYAARSRQKYEEDLKEETKEAKNGRKA